MNRVGPRAEMQRAMPFGQESENLVRNRKLKTHKHRASEGSLAASDPRRAARWQSAPFQTLGRTRRVVGDRKRIVSLGGAVMSGGVGKTHAPSSLNLTIRGRRASFGQQEQVRMVPSNFLSTFCKGIPRAILYECIHGSRRSARMV
jgi:hypothetical protein